MATKGTGVKTEFKESHVRHCENGVIVGQPHGQPGYEGREFVFTDPEPLGDWISDWFSTLARAKQHKGSQLNQRFV
jgi:hypothetical protein